MQKSNPLEISLSLQRLFLTVSFDCELSFLWKIGDKRIFSKKTCFLKSTSNFLDLDEILSGTILFTPIQAVIAVIISTEKGRKIAGLVSFEISGTEKKPLEFSRKLEKCPDLGAKLQFTLEMKGTPSFGDLKLESSFQSSLTNIENESFNGNVWQALENSKTNEQKLEEEINRKAVEIAVLRSELLSKDKSEGKILELKKQLEVSEITLKKSTSRLEEISKRMNESQKEREEIEEVLKHEREISKDLMSMVQELERKQKKSLLDIKLLSGEKEALELERSTFLHGKALYETQITDYRARSTESLLKAEKLGRELEIVRKEKKALENEKEDLEKMFEQHKTELKGSLTNALGEIKSYEKELQTLSSEKETLRQQIISLEKQLSEKFSETQELTLQKNKAFLELATSQREKLVLTEKFELDLEELRKNNLSMENKVSMTESMNNAIRNELVGLKKTKEDAENRELAEREELSKTKQVVKKLSLEIEVLNSEKDAIENEQASWKTKIDELEGINSQLKEKIQNIENAKINNNIEEKYLEILRNLKMREEELEECKKESHHLRQANETLIYEHERTKESLMSHLLEVEELKLEVETFQKSNESQAAQSREQTLKIGKLIGELDHLRMENQKVKEKAGVDKDCLERQLSELKDQILKEHESFITEKADLQKKIEEISKEFYDYRNSHPNESAITSNDDWEKEKKVLESQNKSLINEKSSLKTRINLLIDEKNVLRMRVTDLEKQTESLNNYLNLTLSEASEMQKNQYYLEKKLKQSKRSIYLFFILTLCLRKFAFKNSAALTQENRSLRSLAASQAEKIVEKDDEIQEINSRLIAKEWDNTNLIEEMLINREEMEDSRRLQKKLKFLVFCQNIFRNIKKGDIVKEFLAFEKLVLLLMNNVQNAVYDQLDKMSQRLDFHTQNLKNIKKRLLELDNEHEKVLKENDDLKSLTSSQKLALKNHLELQKRAMFLEKQLKTLTESLENEASLEKKGLLFDILQEKSTIKTQNDKIKEMEDRVSRLLNQKSKTSNKL